MSLWQVSDGEKFAQLVFNGGQLVECEFLRNGRQFAEEFTDNFIDEYEQIHRRIQSIRFSSNRHQFYESSNLGLHDMKPNATLINLRRLQDIPEHFLNLLHLHALETKCNQLHEVVKENLRMRTSELDDADDDDEDKEITNSRFAILKIYSFMILQRLANFFIISLE